MSLAAVGCAIALHACTALPASRLQADSLPGVPVRLDEILSEMKDPPAGHAKREEALVALFKQAGATPAEVQLLPLAETVKPHLEAARGRVTERLKAIGATQNEIDGALKALDKRHASLGRNVKAILRGRTDRVIGFGAHLDSAEGSPGVIDNWASCVLLANLYQTLRTTRPEHTLWFFGFAEQEEGCLGSAAWVDSLETRTLGGIDAFVTIDCTGLVSPQVWWTGSTAATVEMASDVAAKAGLPLQVVDFPGTASDSLSLKRRSIPVLSLFGIDPPRVAMLHTPEDRFEALDPQRVAETFALLRAFAHEFDRHPQPLLWDYVKGKLRINDPASGRKPIRPTKLDLAAVPLPSPPEAPPSPEATPPRDGSPQ